MTDCTDCDHLSGSQCDAGKPIYYVYGRGAISVASQYKRDTEVPCSSFKHTDCGIPADGERSRSASKKHRYALREIRCSALLSGK